jgi:hypothetical protein
MAVSYTQVHREAPEVGAGRAGGRGRTRRTSAPAAPEVGAGARPRPAPDPTRPTGVVRPFAAVNHS